MPTPVRRIITHHSPHLDEQAAIFLLRKFGRKMFPGIETTIVQFVDPNDRPPYPVDQLLAHGIIALGVWGGEFDEHPTPTNQSERKNDECVATLVAKRLGIERQPEILPLLKYTVSNDLNGNDSPFGIASIAKIMFEQKAPYEEVYEWIRKALEIKIDSDPNYSGDFTLQYIAWLMEVSSADGESIRWFEKGMKAKAKKQSLLLTETLTEFWRTGKVIESRGKIIVLIEHSDNEQLWTLVQQGHAFLKDSAQTVTADVFVQRRANGQTMIVGSKKSSAVNRSVMERLARMVRVEELLAAKRAPRDWDELAREGMQEDGRWYYFTAGQMLLNGSRAAKDVLPSRLSISVLIRLVSIALDPTGKEFKSWTEKRKDYLVLH